MSDERLREAERRWRETGAVEDEARYLLERVRVGDLTRERLELAAYCGHEGAALAVNVQVTSAASVEEFVAWLDGLGRWGRSVVARAALAGAGSADRVALGTANAKLLGQLEDVCTQYLASGAIVDSPLFQRPDTSTRCAPGPTTELLRAACGLAMVSVGAPAPVFDELRRALSTIALS